MDLLSFDISSILTLDVILAVVAGTFIGMIIGALPGLGAVIALVLILPFTFIMPPLVAILLLLATYQAAEYGGSISSVILGIPGTAAAVATVQDGAPMAKQGFPGRALGYSLGASTVGGLCGGLVLLFIAEPVSSIALQFSSSEFFLIALLGLVAITALASASVVKTIISVVLGLMVGTVGIDMFTGQPRFDGGNVVLYDGVSLVVVMVGMFAFSELLVMVENGNRSKSALRRQDLKTGLSFSLWKKIFKPTMTGSAIGSAIGVIPGMGAGTASWFAYGVAKKMSRSPETFGKGNPEGIAAPEAANNAVVGGAIVPLLTLGVPGSATTAIVLGAFIIQGIQPGPLLFENEPRLVYGILFGFLLTTIAMYIIGRLVTPLFSRVLSVPTRYLIPLVSLLSIVGVYASSAVMLEVWLALGIGIITFLLKRFDFSTTAFILAFVLSGLIEENLRRTLLLSDGSLGVFVTRPYSLGLVIVMAGLALWTVYGVLKRRKMDREQKEPAASVETSERPR